MGTIFEIAAYDQSSEHASHAIEKAFQEIVRLDNLLSNYKPDSALSNLNRSAHFHAERFRRTYTVSSTRPCSFPGFRTESSTSPSRLW